MLLHHGLLLVLEVFLPWGDGDDIVSTPHGTVVMPSLSSWNPPYLEVMLALEMLVCKWPRIFSSTLLILIIPRVDGDSDSGGFHDAQSEWWCSLLSIRCTTSSAWCPCSSPSWCSSPTPSASTPSSTCSPARSSPPSEQQSLNLR